MNIPLNIDWQQILLHVFNLIILTGGLYFLLYQPVTAFMKKRQEYYAGLEADAQAKLQEAEQKVREADETLSGMQAEAEQLRAETEKAYNEALAAAKKLSELRIEAGKKFSADVERELEFLDMPSVKFIVNDSVGELYENGIDNIEFLLSANAGEEPKPLSKIASGGELSRIMLAIKCVLSELDDIDTLIFDEIDSGVSGRAALKIAAKMKELSKTHQVICVTHLAQIAAFADEHKLISKEEKDGRTYTCIASLDYNGRKYELARIMGGLTVTQSILNSAEELLSSAEIDD